MISQKDLQIVCGIVTGSAVISLLFGDFDWSVWKGNIVILRDCIAMVWGMTLFDWIFCQHGLSRLLVREPRSPIGLLGILFSHFFHQDFRHLWGNTWFFLIFGWLVLLEGSDAFYAVTVVSGFIAGLSVWLLSPYPAIGSSAIVLGYPGFLIAYGLRIGSWLAIAIMVLMLMIYHSTIFRNVCNTGPNTSWLGHWFGFFGGVWTALQLEDILTLGEFLQTLL